MSKSKATTLSDLARRKEKDTGTDTSVESTTASTKAKTSKGKGRATATTSAEGSRGGTGKTAHLGLVIDPVPGGLYRVRNRAGGTPPKDFMGLWTTRSDIQARVAAYNKEHNKEV